VLVARVEGVRDEKGMDQQKEQLVVESAEGRGE
jgi:hypothetical protein